MPEQTNPLGRVRKLTGGISHTIRLRPGPLAGETEAYVFFCGGPAKKLEETTIRRLLGPETALRPGGCLVSGERRGNPVWLFPPLLRPELEALTETLGPGGAQNHWAQAVKVR